MRPAGDREIFGKEAEVSISAHHEVNESTTRRPRVCRVESHSDFEAPVVCDGDGDLLVLRLRDPPLINAAHAEAARRSEPSQKYSDVASGTEGGGAEVVDRGVHENSDAAIIMTFTDSVYYFHRAILTP